MYHKVKFSLIELLMVIAIFAVLISMLQPALSRGISMAHTVACARNFKTMGAVLRYATKIKMMNFQPVVRLMDQRPMISLWEINIFCCPRNDRTSILGKCYDS
jgi:prepilin-type N-terminal cleavage/methylation domain-containing protein